MRPGAMQVKNGTYEQSSRLQCLYGRTTLAGALKFVYGALIASKAPQSLGPTMFAYLLPISNDTLNSISMVSMLGNVYIAYGTSMWV
jgi:hypothetical protein